MEMKLNDLKEYGLSEADLYHVFTLPIGYPLTIVVDEDTINEKHVKLVKVEESTLRLIEEKFLEF